MSMNAADMRSRDDVLRRLRDAWERMTNDQRNMVKTMVELVAAEQSDQNIDDAIAALYQPMTKEEIFESIDLGLAQARRGEGQTLEEVGAELAAEFGFAR